MLTITGIKSHNFIDHSSSYLAQVLGWIQMHWGTWVPPMQTTISLETIWMYVTPWLPALQGQGQFSPQVGETWAPAPGSPVGNFSLSGHAGPCLQSSTQLDPSQFLRIPILLRQNRKDKHKRKRVTPLRHVYPQGQGNFLGWLNWVTASQREWGSWPQLILLVSAAQKGNSSLLVCWPKVPLAHQLICAGSYNLGWHRPSQGSLGPFHMAATILPPHSLWIYPWPLGHGINMDPGKSGSYHYRLKKKAQKFFSHHKLAMSFVCS